MFFRRFECKECPGAGGLVASLKATKGAGTLKAKKGLAKLQDPASGRRRENRQTGSCPRYSIFRSESKQMLRIEITSKRRLLHSQGLITPTPAFVMISADRKDHAFSGAAERGCCVPRRPQTAMSYWRADHNIDRSDCGGDFGHGSPRGCSTGPLARHLSANCFSSDAAPPLPQRTRPVNPVAARLLAPSNPEQP